MVQGPPRDYYPRQQHYQPEHYPYGISSRYPPPQVDRFAGSEFASRNPSFQQDAFPLDTVDGGRTQDVSDIQRRQPPVPIDEALRQHCGIAAKHYFVAAITEDGNTRKFLSPGPALPTETIRQFFDEQKYQQVMGQVAAGLDPMVDDAVSPEQTTYRRPAGSTKTKVGSRDRQSAGEEMERSTPQHRKRRRGRDSFHEVAPRVSAKRGIKIGDADAVRDYYHSIFVAIQQNACKVLAKAWVKLIEPKKQSTHPYTVGEESAPEWWPKPWGTAMDEKVRHKEPDHLYKRERVHLLIHMLRMLVEPKSTQHEDIRHQGFNVKKLEDVTFEAMSSHFTEEEEKLDDSEKKDKRPSRECLQELFVVAKQEQRYKNGEIDDITVVYVKAGDKNKKRDVLDSEEDDESAAPTKEEPQQYSRGDPGVEVHASVAEQRPPPGVHSHSFLGSLPMRDFPPQVVPDMPPHQHAGFVESNGMPLQGSAVNHPGAALGLDFGGSPHPHDSRRPSVFSDYASHPNNNIYPSQWTSGTTAPTTPVTYAYTTQQPNGHHDASFVNQDMPMNHNPAFFGGSFDASSRSGYDTDSFRSADLPPMANLQLQHQ